MATIAVSSGNFIRPYRNVRMRQFPVKVSQTILVGDPIILDTTTDKGNRVAKAGTDPTTDRAVVGFAAEAITTTATFNAATDKVNVWVATQDAEFLVHCEDAAAIDNDDIGVEYGIVADATNSIYRLDRSDTTNKVFRVLELVDVHGDVNGRLIASVIAPERLYGD